MKVCDVCRKEIPSDPFLPVCFPVVSISITERLLYGTRTVDLCRDCQMRVYDFVTNREGLTSDKGDAE